MARDKTAEKVLGTAEVAALLGLSPKTVSSYLARGQMVLPAVTLACGPIWLRADVERWNAKRPSRQAA